MATELVDFLEEYTQRPFVWGTDDCCMMVADWWQANHGVDPATHLRGTYADAVGKERTLATLGGLKRTVADICRRVGAQRTLRATPGDFGVVLVDGTAYAAICCGAAWAVRSEGGLIFARDVKVVAAWAI